MSQSETPPSQETPEARWRRLNWPSLPTVETTSNSLRAVVVNLVLLAVIVLAAPLIASQAARDQILLEPISIPAGLQVTGLTPEVAANRLNDGMLQIIREAGSGKSSINPIPEGEATTFDIPESGISVDALVSYARKFFNLHETVIGGEFRCGDAACTPALVSLRLRIRGPNTEVVELPPMRRSTEAEYWRDAALRVMSTLDPFTALAAEVDLHPSNAATIARRLIASEHEDTKWAQNVLGNVRRNEGAPEDAIAAYSAALAIDRSFVPALTNMASVLIDEGRLDEAGEYLTRLAAVDRDNPLEAEVQGDLARARGDIDGAKEWYIKASERDPLDARYKTKAGFMLMSEGRTEEALELGHEAFALDPSDPLPLGLLGGHYSSEGDFVALEKLYRDAAEFTPENDAVQAMHANLLMINKDYAAALLRIDQALLIDEGNVKYRLLRADALAQLGRHEDALMDIELARLREPSNPEVYYAMAKSLDALGREAESTAAYRQVVLLDPESINATVAQAFINETEAAEAAGAVPAAEESVTTP